MPSTPVYTLEETPVTKKKGHKRNTSKSSIGSDQSLTYSANSSVQSASTTGESSDSKILGGDFLKTEEFRQPTTGQPSNSLGNDGGSNDMAIFMEANHSPKKRQIKDSSSSTISRSSRDKSVKGKDNKNSNSNRNSTAPPPRMPIQKNSGKELWYSQMWMCGFADSLFNWDQE